MSAAPRTRDRFWIRGADRQAILEALLAATASGGGLRIDEVVAIVQKTCPRPVSKATVYRLLAEAGWKRDWSWAWRSGSLAITLQGAALRLHAEALRGRTLSASSVYRVLRRHGWRRCPAWLPPAAPRHGAKRHRNAA